MSITGEDVIVAFTTYCAEYSRLFIPDVPRQDAVADSLAKHYNSDDLLEAIRYFVKNDKGPYLIFEFALKSKDIIEKSKFERESGEKFKEIVAQTRKKLESDEL